MRRSSIWLLASLLGLGGCVHQDARQAWEDVLKKCAANDPLGPDVLYFGPSNEVGPGSIWRAVDGGYNLRWQLSDMGSPKVVVDGAPATCDGQAKIDNSISAGLSFLGKSSVFSADLSLDLKRADTIQVGVKTWQWDQIDEGPWEMALAAATNTTMSSDARQPERFVMTKALKVTDLQLDATFSKDNAASLKAKYAPTGSYQLSANATAEWKTDTTLHIATTGTAYLAGTLNRVNTATTRGATVGPPVPNLNGAVADINPTH